MINLNKFRIKNEKKQTTFNLIVNIFTYAISTIISLVLTPFLIKYLGEETYSFYPVSNNIINYMTIVSTSLNTMASRFIVLSLMNNDRNKANSYFSSTIAADSIFSIVLMVVFSIMIILINKFLNVPINLVAAVRFLFIFTFASAIVNIVATPFGVATIAKNRTDLRAFRELIMAIFKLTLYILFYKLLPISLVYIGIIALIVNVLSLLIQLFYTKNLIPELRFSFSLISKSHIKEILISSIWVSVNSLANLLLSGTTIILLNVLYNPTLSGIISITQTIPHFLGGVISLLVSVFYPVIAKYYSKANDNYSELVDKIITINKIIGGFGCACISVFTGLGSIFFSLWTPTQETNTLVFLSLISMLPYIFTSCFWSSTSVFTIMNKVKIPAILTTVTGLISIAIQIILGLCKLNYVSLHIASCLCQAVANGIIFPIYLSKITHSKFIVYYKYFPKIIFASLISFGIAFSLKNTFVINSWIKFAIVGAGSGIISLIIFAISLFNKNEIIKFIKGEKK